MRHMKWGESCEEEKNEHGGTIKVRLTVSKKEKRVAGRHKIGRDGIRFWHHRGGKTDVAANH